MKILSKITLMVTVILTSCTYSGGSDYSQCNKKSDEILVPLPTEVEKQNLAQNEIFVQLSPRAEVELKNESSYTGQLIAANSKQITVKVDSGREILEDVTNIQGIVFHYDKIVLCGKGKAVLRGGGKDSQMEKWNLSLDNLSLVDPIKGRAKLNLEDLNPSRQQGIKTSSLDTTFRIENIDLKSESTQIIEVKLYD